MKKIKLRKWDSAEHLETEADMALYLQACLESENFSLRPLRALRVSV